MTRRAIYTKAPDKCMTIFCDQIAYIAEVDGGGSLIVTSDGTRHTFCSVPYEAMVASVTEVSTNG
jgi:hypothetical protein